MERKGFINNEIRLPFVFISPCSTIIYPGKSNSVLMTLASHTFLFSSNPQVRGHVG